MKKILLAGIAAAAFCSAPALAADMPVKADPVAIFNWTGMYVGGTAGYSWGKENASYFGRTCDVGGCRTFRPDGGIIGPVIGIQAQAGNWVWGLEASWNWSSQTDKGLDAPLYAVNFDARAKILDYLTVGPRLGYATGNWLLFATGGYANANIQDDFILRVTGAPNATSVRHGGWFVGGGIDTVVANNVIFGIEYQHVDYNSKVHLGAAVPTVDVTRTVNATDDVVRARLTFKMVPPFGTGSR